jgi:hypothetical protein
VAVVRKNSSCAILHRQELKLAIKNCIRDRKSSHRPPGSGRTLTAKADPAALQRGRAGVTPVRARSLQPLDNEKRRQIAHV